MSHLVIHAASYLGPEGYGNDQTGLNPWPAEVAGKLKTGKLDGLHWSLFSNADPSRFLRMDLMCRLGFLAAELLEMDFDAMPSEKRERIGVIVESFAGSLDTDIRFAQTPRPSSFAYTLPSTVIGELCIRYRLKGPVLSLVAAETGGHAVLAEAAECLRASDAEMVLCLSIEALNPATARTIALPEKLSPHGWHSAALLLGPPETNSREKVLPEGSLQAVCQNLCIARERAC